METGKLLRLFKKYLPLLLIVIFAVVSRLLPHPPNFTPVGGLALFSGTYLSGFSSFILPLLIMALSDVVLGFHSTILYVYGSFILIVLIGRLLRGKISFKRLVISGLISSSLFFIITNCGVWAHSSIYTKDLNGLLQSYIMGIPFFKNTILGDLFYTLALFYSFQFVTIIGQRLIFSHSPPKKSS